MIWHRFSHSHRSIVSLMIPILATSVLLGGCAKVTELATGECQGGSTAVLIGNSPTETADPEFRADQSAAAIDESLVACDELHLASFSSTAQEIDLKGTSTEVEGKNSSVRNENRPAMTAAIVERVEEHLESTAADPAGSDLVAAVDFAHRTYLADSEEGVRLIIISDGLATRPDLSDPQVVADPEGAVGALARAGLDDVDLTGIEVLLVGVGHSAAADPLPRELVDTLLDVWEQALARAGAQVEALEALPGSAGKAAAVRDAGSETDDSSEEGASAPIPSSADSSGYVRSGLQTTSRRRIRRPGRAEHGNGRTPFTPAVPDRTTATTLHVAADPSTGAATTSADETRAIVAMADAQGETIAGRLARRCRRLLSKAARKRPAATVQWMDIADAVRDSAREEQELRGTRMVVAGRTHRTLSRRAAIAIETAVVCFDAWALGSAAAIAADLPILDGVLVALGGTAGMVIGAKVLGVAVAHDLEERRFGAKDAEDADPAVKYFSTELFRHLEKTQVLILLGLGAGLVLTAAAVGFVRAESGGRDVAALMFGLTLFTTIATTFVEVLSANVLADQVDERTKRLQLARRAARRTTRTNLSRDLRAFNHSVALLTAHGEDAVARHNAHNAIARASMHLRFAAHESAPTSGASADPAIESLRSSDLIAPAPQTAPFVGVDLSVGRNLSYLRPLTEHLDNDLRLEHQRAAREHWKVVSARLKKAGIDVSQPKVSDDPDQPGPTPQPLTQGPDRMKTVDETVTADLRDSVDVVSPNGSDPKSTAR